MHEYTRYSISIAETLMDKLLSATTEVKIFKGKIKREMNYLRLREKLDVLHPIGQLAPKATPR